jgi:hypothetical protein
VREFNIARSMGLKTAVTTNNRVIRSHHRASMMALPRISLNRVFNDVGCLEVVMSGAAELLRS